MSEDTLTKRYYNRKERRDMRKQGTLVRFKANGDQVVCNHLENGWCGECIDFGEDVEVTLPDGSTSKGTIHTNF